MTEIEPRIFLCHASEDKPRVRELYHQLKAAGCHPWLDEEELLPGQDWWTEIKKVIDEPPDESRCNFDGNIGDVTPVGQYSPQGDSPYGCVDVVGNVWEWCSSPFKSYPNDPQQTGREIPGAVDSRMIRGGSCELGERGVRCAVRRSMNSRGYEAVIGFRVCVPAQ